MIKNLAEVSNIIPGYAFKQSDFVENSISIAIKIKDIQPPYVNLEKSSMVNIPEQLLHKFEKYRVKDGDILIAMTGATIGKVGRVPDFNSYFNVFINQRVCRVDPKKDIDKDFLYFLLSNYNFEKHIFNFIDSQTAQPNISAKSIGKYQFDLPDLPTQKRISSFILSLENKIKINLKLNKSLEELAQTLYKHWFVDFEFPNKEGKPYKSSGGEMVESEIGIIPKEWNVTHLDDLFDFERGIEPGSKNYSETKTEGHIPFIRVGDLESTPKIYVDTSLVKDKTCKPDDVMISFDGAIGRVGIGLSGAYSTGIRKVTSKNNDIGFSFIYGLVKSQNIQDQILTYANGTTILHAGSSIKHLVMPFNLGAVLKLEQILQPLMKKILNNFDENRNLEALRDTLLPRLMSGEIEV
jgi:type I restriction enzyme S subunit